MASRYTGVAVENDLQWRGYKFFPDAVACRVRLPRPARRRQRRSRHRADYSWLEVFKDYVSEISGCSGLAGRTTESVNPRSEDMYFVFSQGFAERRHFSVSSIA